MTTPNTPTGLLRILGQEKDMTESDRERMESAANRMTEPRWYCLSREGMATLCTDKADAEMTAINADELYPRAGPHRAVQLVEAAPQPQQAEPYCYVYEYDSPLGLHRALYPNQRNGKLLRTVPVYTHQAPAPQPVGLTMADAAKGFASYGGVPEGHAVSALWFARGIAFAEREHGIPAPQEKTR